MIYAGSTRFLWTPAHFCAEWFESLTLTRTPTLTVTRCRQWKKHLEMELEMVERAVAIRDWARAVGAPLEARCTVFGKHLHSGMPSGPARLKLLHACDQWYSSRVSTMSYRCHRKLRPNTEGATTTLTATLTPPLTHGFYPNTEGNQLC
jgi:hypothetical protein